MKRNALIATFIVLAIVGTTTGCKKNNEEAWTEEILPSVTHESESPRVENSTVPMQSMMLTPSSTTPDCAIKGIQGLNQITMSSEGVRFPSGTIRKAYYFLPGYKEIAIDLNDSRDDIESIFTSLATAPNVPLDEAVAWHDDGSGLYIEYSDELENSYTITLYTTYEAEYISLMTTPWHDGSVGLIASSEINDIIHQIANWKPFDVQELSCVNEMRFQIESGEKESEEIVVITGDECNELIQLIIDSAEVEGSNASGFNISVSMLEDGRDRFHAYFAGDGANSIAIETEYFQIDKKIIYIVYQMIGLTDILR